MENADAEFDLDDTNSSSSPTARSRAEIAKILAYAKLDPDDLLPSCQRIHFTADLDNDQVKLMEVDENLSAKIRQGHKMVLRGDEHENIVLCTDDTTYELKEAETSNSLLISSNILCPDQLADNSDEVFKKSVSAVLHSYFELKPCRPRLKKLLAMLESNPYCGRVEEANNNKRKYTYDDFLNTIQASEQELRDALKRLQVCLLHGYMRIIDFELLSKILTDIEGLMYERAWTVERIPAQECSSALEELYDSHVVRHVLTCYGDRNVDSSEGVDTFALNEEKFAKFYATMLLRDTGKFHFRDFMDTWQQSLPEGMITHLSYLQGLAIVDRSSKPEVVWYFDVDNLPEDINERLNALFKTKEKWTLEEITPYVEEFAGDKTTVNALLTKYCRTSTQQGVRVYSTRRPVY